MSALRYVSSPSKPSAFATDTFSGLPRSAMLSVAYLGEWNRNTFCTTLPFTGSITASHEAVDCKDVGSFAMVSRFPETVHRLETSKLACITPEPAPYAPNAVCRGYVCSPDCALSTSFMEASMAACAASSSSSSSSASAAKAGERSTDAAPTRDAETTARRVGPRRPPRSERERSQTRRTWRRDRRWARARRVDAARHGGAGALPARVGAD